MASVIRGSDNFDSLTSNFDVAHSFTTNGYQKLSNGLIIQWGKLTGVELSGAGTAILFPVSFPAKVASLHITPSKLIVDYSNATVGGGAYNSGTLTLSGVTIGVDEYLNTGIGNLDWFAIGY